MQTPWAPDGRTGVKHPLRAATASVAAEAASSNYGLISRLRLRSNTEGCGEAEWRGMLKRDMERDVCRE